jgi:hypothetical protein
MDITNKYQVHNTHNNQIYMVITINNLNLNHNHKYKSLNKNHSSN